MKTIPAAARAKMPAPILSRLASTASSFARGAEGIVKRHPLPAPDRSAAKAAALYG
jgi:hypothetical protein